MPCYNEMVSMIPIGQVRPTLTEYPIIADNITRSIYEVQYGIKEPKQALDDAAAKSAKILGR
jgi:multiple sugar transport system substrate-binding protein